MNANEIITNEERETIVHNMADLLAQYDYEYTFDALYKIVDTWATRKADLITHFKRHPNYVEGKFLIAFQHDYNRKVDDDIVDSFVLWCANKAVNKFGCCNAFGLPPLMQAISFGGSRPYICEQFVSEEFINYATDTYGIADWLGIKPGMKTSRMVNKILTHYGIGKDPEYNREFAKFSDAINPLQIVRHTIISINPIDYLTMSFGNSWASCHTIDKENKRCMPNSYEGMYSSGTISYMLDSTSMVFYTVDASYNGTDYFFQDKINRNMFHYGEDKLVQGRLYPQCNDNGSEGLYKDIRAIVQKVIADCYGVPNWGAPSHEKISDYVISRGTNYKDYTCFDNCKMTKLKGSENDESIVIGMPPICINCGCEHHKENNINCCTGFVCSGCGCLIDNEDDVFYVDGDTYCGDCVTWCDCCDEWVYYANAIYIEGEERYVCASCLNEYYERCECCGNWIYLDDVYVTHEGNFVCCDCKDENYYYCEGCGELFHEDQIHFDDDGNAYCPDCYEEENEEEA